MYFFFFFLSGNFYNYFIRGEKEREREGWKKKRMKFDTGQSLCMQC